MQSFMFFSPLEQFKILPLFSMNLHFYGFNLAFDINNLTITFISFYICYVIFFTLLKNPETNTFFVFPQGSQIFFQRFFSGCKEIVQQNLSLRYYEHSIFPFIFCLAFILVTLNVGSSIPMTMCATSQIAVIGSLCLMFFSGTILFGLFFRGITFLRTFYAPGTGVMLGTLLVPIELIAYCFKPLSIFCRLCSNLMSGHTILKVVFGAIYGLTKISTGGIVLAVMTSFILFLIVPLFMLEFLVYLIQAYVFVVLYCLFFKDTLGHYHRH